ncbi:hypothetical protein CRI93_02765 [Longimonas halophila]|uniref:protein-glutamate O-methyltransferase n=2 Tax=Longimonas halophila TaxID=1469170 RepID=A0A2H3NVG2_9BACT|nr:hypothetical protein CRI93_02765 [Longimonas halophila]
MDAMAPTQAPKENSTSRLRVVGIGASAGGIEALKQFFSGLSEAPDMVFVVVMHLVPDQSSELAEVLQHCTSMPVRQVTEPADMEAGHVYVVEPGHALDVDGNTLISTAFEDPAGRVAPIDHFFRSLARSDLEMVGVILSGAGSDGAVGMRAIAVQCGLTGVQSPDEAGYDSMPRAAIELLQEADFVLPAAQLAERIETGSTPIHALQTVDAPDDVGAGIHMQETLRAIFAQVRMHTGQDFDRYKRPTMLRRIQRRMQVRQVPSLSAYLDLIEDEPAEAQRLRKEFLISVSSFFRNPEAFSALRDQVLPAIYADKNKETPIRVWVPGCATGEEAYSLAILLMEEAATHDINPEQIQIFASDLDKEALAKARAGRYPASIAADVPTRYLNTYFRDEETWYVVKDILSERVIFTLHDLLRDPPFSKLDLISCRNLLIYLRRELQTSVFKLFNYALNDGGYLFLGSSESTGGVDDLFRLVDKTHCLYQSTRNENTTVPELPSTLLALNGPRWRETKQTSPSASSSTAAQIHRRMLETYAPPSAVVDKNYTIVHLSRGVGRYLEHPAGTPSANIVEVVRPELQIKLQTSLRNAFADEEEVNAAPVQVQLNGTTEWIRLFVSPSKGTSSANANGMALVMFIKDRVVSDRLDGDADAKVSRDSEGDDLREELSWTKNQLRTTIEEHETSKQEMRAANEELRSMNEEYKSMTEELETSKEELQSVNEELKTVNAELEAKVNELHQANSDLQNLIVATDIGTLFLDTELCIQRFTPPVKDLFNIQKEDTDRSISAFTHRLEYTELDADARTVLKEQTTLEREVKSETDRWFLIRIRPYRTIDDAVEGVVFTFMDITHRKKSELKLKAATDRLRQRTEQVHALNAALTVAEERERQRLSQVLHDDLQQLLVAAQIRVNQLQSSNESASNEGTSDKDTSEILQKVADELQAAIQTTRHLSSELMPPIGDDSLCDALQWLALHMKNSYGLSVDLETETPCPPLESSVHTLLFRTTRELLFNVVKHADVDEARVTVTADDDSVRITVSDEGAGFNPAEHTEETEEGQGLFSIRERLEMIGGWYNVEAEPGAGTRITIGVPNDAGTTPSEKLTEKAAPESAE